MHAENYLLVQLSVCFLAHLCSLPPDRRELLLRTNYFRTNMPENQLFVLVFHFTQLTVETFPVAR